MTYNVFFLWLPCTCEETCESVSIWRKSLRKFNLRLLASLFGQGFTRNTIFINHNWMKNVVDDRGAQRRQKFRPMENYRAILSIWSRIYCWWWVFFKSACEPSDPCGWRLFPVFVAWSYYEYPESSALTRRPPRRELAKGSFYIKKIKFSKMPKYSKQCVKKGNIECLANFGETKLTVSRGVSH